MRRFVLRHIKAGSLSVTGAAFVAEVSKMTVSRWCAQAGIAPDDAEHRRWMDLRAQARRLVDGQGVRNEVEPEHHPRSGPSKEALRKQAEWAVSRGSISSEAPAHESQSAGDHGADSQAFIDRAERERSRCSDGAAE